MNIYTFNMKDGTCSIEIFVSHFALVIAIYRIRVISLKDRKVKQICTGTDFFIRRKADPQFSVRGAFCYQSSMAVMISATPALSSAPRSVVPSVVISVLPFKEVRDGKSLTFKTF